MGQGELSTIQSLLQTDLMLFDEIKFHAFSEISSVNLSWKIITHISL